jgi:hypothetical protein
MKGGATIVLLNLLLSLINTPCAQTAGDYRSKQNGAWHVASSWQTFNGSTWVDASAFPSYASGTITILSGHTITSSATDSADQVVINSGGTLNIFGGTLTITDGAGTDLTCNGTLALSNGTLNGAGSMAFAAGSTFNWSGGILGGSGVTTINAGSAFNMNGGTHYLADTRTLNNYCIWTWTGGTFYYYNGSAVVNNFGVFNIATDDDVSGSNSSAATFNNKAGGVINKTGSPLVSTYFNNISSFTNDGTVNITGGELQVYGNVVNSGTFNVTFGANLNFTAGTATVTTGSVLTGSGSLNFDGATVSVNAGTVSVSTLNLSAGTLMLSPTVSFGNGNALNFSGGTLNGAGNISFNSGSTFNWSGGMLGGSGVTTINTGAAFNMNGGTVSIADTRTINNYGNWTWTGGGFYFYNAAPVVNNYGTFNMYTNASILSQNGSTGSLNNNATGVINKLGSLGNETSVNGTISFVNKGTINLNASRLRFNANTEIDSTVNIAFGAEMNFTGNTAAIDAGAVLSGMGNVNFDGAAVTSSTAQLSVANSNLSAGTLTLASSLNVGSNGKFNFLNGTLNGTGDIMFHPGSTFNWSGGMLGGSGVTTINTGAAFNMNGSTHYLAETRTLNNYSNWTWTGGALYYYNGSAVVNNNGTFNIFTDDDVFAGNSGAAIFSNMLGGVINKIGSPSDETSFNSFNSFTNAGAININSGNLALNVNGTHTGTYRVAFGSQLRGSVSMIFAGPSFVNNGGVTLPGLFFSGTTPQALSGTGSIYSLTINNTNSVTLGGTQTINNSFALVAGKLSLGDNDLLIASPASFGGGNANNYIVTNGRGSLQRRVSNNATNVLFPIGSKTSYMPALVQLSVASTSDDIKVRVRPNVYGSYDSLSYNPVGAPITANTVNGTWFVAEGTAGGSNATVTLQWNAADEAAGFNRTGSRFGQYISGNWNLDVTKAAAGGNPYTLSRSGLTAFSFFAVTNQFVTTTGNYVALCSGGTVNVPYTAVGTFNAGNVFTVQLSDSTGSFAAPVNIGSVSATTSGMIAATIPNTTLAGSGYKIRITSTSPALISPLNPSAIPIRSCSTPVLTKSCGIPGGLNATNITLHSVQLNWSSVYSANGGYEVQFKRTAAANWTLITVANTGLLIDTLQPNTSYDVSVRAKCASTYSAFSGVLSFTTSQTITRVEAGPPVGKFLIYPNPNHGTFALQLHFSEAQTGLANLEVRSVNGQLVYAEAIPITGYEMRKDLSLNAACQSGVYIVTIKAGNAICYGKMIFQKE